MGTELSSAQLWELGFMQRRKERKGFKGVKMWVVYLRAYFLSELCAFA